MKARKYLPNYTYRNYEQWEGKWELIGGIPYAMSPSPSPKHQRLSVKLGRYFDEALEVCANCFISMPIDWKVSEGTVLQPDLLIFCQELKGQYLEKAPELVIEILSPSTALKDRHLKYEIYEQQGVKYYLIVNPTNDTIEIYLHDKTYQLDSTINQKNTSYNFSIQECQFSIDFSKIW